jgi:hypothetical protein
VACGAGSAVGWGVSSGEGWELSAVGFSGMGWSEGQCEGGPRGSGVQREGREAVGERYRRVESGVVTGKEGLAALCTGVELIKVGWKAVSGVVWCVCGGGGVRVVLQRVSFRMQGVIMAPAPAGRVNQRVRSWLCSSQGDFQHLSARVVCVETRVFEDKG